MDLNAFSSIFWKVQHSQSRHQKTTSNLLRITLTPPLENVSSVCKFLKILMVSDKTIHKAFRIHKTLQGNPLEKFYIICTIQYSPKLYFGFNRRDKKDYDKLFFFNYHTHILWTPVARDYVLIWEIKLFGWTSQLWTESNPWLKSSPRTKTNIKYM